MILSLDEDCIPFGLRNNREVDWNQENKSGSIKGPYPFGPGSLSPFSLLQASAATSIHPFGDRVIPPRKRREGDWIRGGLHQD